ncbi:hypothetical protein F5890DRAFT_1421989 [Lentinula detonsa]|uniref:CxC1-like cysteine cluster associated with KDZ transposases domain-containing protein n=1 Tax=Lentinula detonsa TaxID=2804962 RepID=A0AA38PPL2_9AGAR|nr:hypothetical protein F5890DRAFT_1421989 [Lentinula detonsa]
MRIPKSQLESSPIRPQTPSRSRYAAFPSSPHSKSPSKKHAPVILYGPHGRSYAQRRFLPTPRGQVGFLERPLSDLGMESDTLKGREVHGQGHVDPFISDTAGIAGVHTPHCNKRLKQAFNWQTLVIPSLTPVYMTYLYESANLAREVTLEPQQCVCMGSAERRIDVTVVLFNKLQKISLTICQCRTAATQLMRLGLFGCAPIFPSLAVDIRLLDFVTRLFLRISPNVTAFCSAIEDFLKSQGYQLRGQDPLRRRFSNALRWFNALQQSMKSTVDASINQTRSKIQSLNTSPPDVLPPAPSPSSAPPPLNDCDIEEELFGIASSSDDEREQSEPLPKRARTDDTSPQVLLRPSEYLRSRCPLCFGGNTKLEDGAIVCLDACFTQKHNKQVRDPLCEHPRTSFVPQEQVDHWQVLVDSVRAKKIPVGSEEEDDRIESHLKVPKSVLDTCNDSFTAADGDRQKASTQFFDCTAVMGLLCRHDNVLWLVNMTSAGERQHYALALVDILFKHLPPNWSVGILYDIACQLERSCVKWGFLSDHLPRIRFAISVFHAFGHGWACQCIYHPRKCLGFGLSDGEGCERFWHMISPLIAYLRVCGFYTRLYTLDLQIQHINRVSLERIAIFLVRKWKTAQVRREEGEKDVLFSTRNAEFLRGQWQLQVASATCPLPRQARNAGKKAVEGAIQLRRARDTLLESQKRLESIVTDVSYEPYEIAEAEIELPVVREKLLKVQSTLRTCELRLGVEGMRDYRRLASSQFFRERMNACALKTRICQRLRARKFERDRIERSFRRQMNTSERKLHNHTESTVKRRDGGIEVLVRKYNQLCKSMSDMIASQRAPANAQAPKPLVTKELFTLDIDDAVWDDTGLTEKTDVEHLPLWLSDEQVQTGIRGILLQDRADEELKRLKHELSALGDWFNEEFTVIQTALTESHDRSLSYQLQLQSKYLIQLSVQWTHTFSVLPADVIPTLAGVDMQEEIGSDIEGNHDVVCEDGMDECDGYDDFEDNGLDLALMEHMDTLDIADEYADYNDI